MARDFNGSNQYLENATAVLTTTPISIACWALPDTSVVNMCGCGIFGNSDYHMLKFASGNTVQAATSTSAAGETTATTSTTFTDDTLIHACAVFASATDRRAFLNGGGKGTGTTSRTPAALDTTTIGRRSSAAASSYFDGRLAEVGVWDVALSDEEVATLADGVSPLLVQPMSLVAYWPIWGRYSPEIDLMGWGNMTVTGATQVDHPKIIMPRRRKVFLPAAAAPGGDAVPQVWAQYRLRHAG